MNTKKIAQEILAAEIQVEDTPAPEKAKPKPGGPVTTIPQPQIDAAIELAGMLREKVTSLMSELDLASNDLSGDSSPSVLESQDDFKSLVLRLKQMKRKLMVV